MEDILHQLTSKNLVSLCDLGFLQVLPVPFATIACWKPINPAHQQVMAPRQTCDKGNGLPKTSGLKKLGYPKDPDFV